jgi:hypothetical protein
MDIAAPRSNRQQSVCTAWGVPWPSDDDLRADADTAWAVEVGLVDPGECEAGAFDDECAAFADAVAGIVDVPSRTTESVGAEPEVWLRELERQVRVRQRATADEYRLIRLVLERAATDTVPWVGHDPTLDLAWSDSRGRTVAAVRRDRIDMAERAAIAEIATRLRLSEQTVRTRAAHADVLQERCPELWTAFTEGRVSERHAVESARLATSLPEEAAPAGSVRPGSVGDPAESFVDGRDATPDGTARPADQPAVTPDGAPPVSETPESWRAFDEGALDRALRLPPARFTVAARALRERVHRESIEARHRRAARDRGVWLTPELDGMATLTALLPADRAHDALSRVDRIARQLRLGPDETRTLAKLRADAVADLLTRSEVAAESRALIDGAAPSTAPQSTHVTRTSRPATIVVTVPALTLLGAGSEPATLDGYGPIDLDTARRLAGEATSWVRVLSHPVTGAALALDRSTYRVPTALRRWLGVTSPTCVFPGCGRPARDCDLDHLNAWSEGGVTDDDNLAPECRHHHRLRHETRWHPSRAPDTGEVRWTSPLGSEIEEDPPPF